MERKEGLPIIRIMMLLSGMAPLFLLMLIRGNTIKDFNPLIINGLQITFDMLFYGILLILIIIPTIVLFARLAIARQQNDIAQINIQGAKQNKEYLFTYLFTILLPIYSLDISTFRNFIAICAAILMILFVLFNLNMHFINFIFAWLGYRVFVIENDNTTILLSARHKMPQSKNELKVHRLSNSVFIEIKGAKYD